MSLKIIKAGLLGTVQDMGRYGYQHLGINPGGAMDRFSAQLANALLGKELGAPVLELHFPAATIRFAKATIISITGAHFSPLVDGSEVPLCRPVAVRENAVLSFAKPLSGARCYVSCLGDLLMDKWLGSYSTNIKAGAGGWQGRALQTGDELPYKNETDLSALLHSAAPVVLPWKAVGLPKVAALEFIRGSEWNWLTEEAKGILQNEVFQVSQMADRMGYRLVGKVMERQQEEELVSSGVSFGTVQLLPSGQLIVLMADHQTTGGYPRIANIITAHLPLLAQMRMGEQLRLGITDLETAEQKLLEQQKMLQQMSAASKLKLENLLHVSL